MHRSIALLTASLMIVSPALAADPATVVAEKDGFRFEYTTELEPGGRVHIHGRDLDHRDRFSFVVEPDGYVYGSVGNSRVSFPIGRKKRDRLVASLVSSEPISVAQSSTSAIGKNPE